MSKDRGRWSATNKKQPTGHWGSSAATNACHIRPCGRENWLPKVSLTSTHARTHLCFLPAHTCKKQIKFKQTKTKKGNNFGITEKSQIPYREFRDSSRAPHCHALHCHDTVVKLRHCHRLSQLQTLCLDFTDFSKNFFFCFIIPHPTVQLPWLPSLPWPTAPTAAA